ncbi:DUF493 domain-containing protein [bacterium]|nr:DUF493 domain-containing protein [bacterium]
MKKEESEIVVSEPKIEYPCQWHYRVIGMEESLIREAVAHCIKEMDYTLKMANTSRTGKFISLNLEIVVGSEHMRNQIFITLRDHINIKMVL